VTSSDELDPLALDAVEQPSAAELQGYLQSRSRATATLASMLGADEELTRRMAAARLTSKVISVVPLPPPAATAGGTSTVAVELDPNAADVVTLQEDGWIRVWQFDQSKQQASLAAWRLLFGALEKVCPIRFGMHYAAFDVLVSGYMHCGLTHIYPWTCSAINLCASTSRATRTARPQLPSTAKLVGNADICMMMVELLG